MHSTRFGRDVHVTRHARERMVQRDISDGVLHQLVECGEVRRKDELRIWIAASLPGRRDNMICVAAVIEERLVIKTVMHHFRWEA